MTADTVREIVREELESRIKNDPFLNLEWFEKEFGVTRAHLEKVSRCQRGLMKKFTPNALARFPKFIMGPGGLGMYTSQYIAWREEQDAPLPGCRPMSARRRAKGKGIGALLGEARR